MNRIILLLVISLFLVAACPASAQAYIPENAVMLSETEADGVRTSVYNIPDTGEQLTLASDIASGEILSLKSRSAAVSAETPMDAEAAKAMLAGIYPDALVVSSAESNLDTAVVRRLIIVAPDLCGCILFDADGVCGKDIVFDACIRDGRITSDAARSIMQFLRPDAKITEIELDDDDGLLLYEGEARIDGQTFEFEMDAATGKLLQWSR